MPLKPNLTLLLFAACYSFSSAQTPEGTITWGTAASQPYPVNEAQGRAINGKLYTFGGFDVLKAPKFTPTKRSYVYDPVTNTWNSIADLPFTPNGSNFGGITHSGIATDGTNIYLAGGYTSNSTGTGQIFGTAQAWRYNVSANNYTRLTNLPYPTSAAQLEYLNGRLHLIGGTNPSRTADLGDHLVLDLNNMAAGWKTLAPVPNPRHHAGSAVFNGKIYYIGGQHHHDAALVTQKDVHAYDPATNTWSKVADMPVPAGATGRGHIGSSVVITNDRIIVLAGETSHGVRTDIVSSYSPATNAWHSLTKLPSRRYSGVAAVFGNTIYYTGGSGTGTTYKGLLSFTSTATTIQPADDAFVRNGAYAGINYGKNDSIAVKTYATAANYSRISYLKFPVNALNIVSARLRVFGKNLQNTNTINLGLYGVTNDSWTESGITWNNAPALPGSAIATFGVNNVAKYFEQDVTAFVKQQATGDKVASFAIKDPVNQNIVVRFNSRENVSNRPELVITTSTTANASNSIISVEDDIESPRVYPNPAKNKINIVLPKQYTGSISIRLTDLQGKSFSMGKYDNIPGEMEIQADLGILALKPGVYFLTITNRKIRSRSIRLVVE